MIRGHPTLRAHRRTGSVSRMIPCSRAVARIFWRAHAKWHKPCNAPVMGNATQGAAGAHSRDRGRDRGRREGAALAFFVALTLQGCQRPGASDLAEGRAATRAQQAPRHEAAAPAPIAPLPAPAREIASAEAFSDPAISARVAASLRADPAMAGADVSVNTVNGVVSIAGRVKSREQAAIATLHAQRPDGVMRIESHLAVEAG
jgi:hypothetical protein